LLVEHFVATSCSRHRQPIRTISPEVMQALTETSWPGNVRELQHYIERAVVTTTGPEFSCKDIVATELDPAGHDLRAVARGAIRQAERARILQSLQKTGGNRAKAAKLLKVSRASLYNKIRDYQIK
jgi:two-component system response regulator AtoC